ncbi:hypothetical protein GDO81_007513 [Engystomops pustulosus]|uniref:Uncharacterized protein n=1 Tax=Engystomops pustulosus TaxID=76066 RepID=A0AAV7C8P8_ENGPU|nr:hypothetical protein GDO81_007513 [Engystomops pustulosus]
MLVASSVFHCICVFVSAILHSILLVFIFHRKVYIITNATFTTVVALVSMGASTAVTELGFCMDMEPTASCPICCVYTVLNR